MNVAELLIFSATCVSFTLWLVYIQYRKYAIRLRAQIVRMVKHEGYTIKSIEWNTVRKFTGLVITFDNGRVIYEHGLRGLWYTDSGLVKDEALINICYDILCKCLENYSPHQS